MVPIILSFFFLYVTLLESFMSTGLCSCFRAIVPACHYEPQILYSVSGHFVSHVKGVYMCLCVLFFPFFCFYSLVVTKGHRSDPIPHSDIKRILGQTLNTTYVRAYSF